MAMREPCPVTIEKLDMLAKERRRNEGAKGQLRGHTAEMRVLTLLRSSLPRGITDVRLSSRREDAKGIDIVLTSSAGYLFLQIKCSNGGKRSFAKKHRRPIIAVVVVSKDINDDGLYRILNSKIQNLRRTIHKIRRKQHQKKKVKLALLK
jgi:hypothetical protein